MKASSKTPRTRILLTNDDGIFATGINVIGGALAKRFDVTVVAPDSNQSGSSHSLTLGDILPIRQITMPCGIKGFALRGTPTDCILVALLDVMKDDPPDLVVSGCNHGPNVGYDVLYSGTVSAALEGLRHHVPSIALSLDMEHGVEPHHFETAAAVLLDILAKPKFYSGIVQATSILNINVPNVPPADIRGTMITKQGIRAYENYVDKQYSPRGRAYYWIAGNSGPHDAQPGSDGYALAERYVSVTPVNLDLTCDELLGPLEKRRYLVDRLLAGVRFSDMEIAGTNVKPGPAHARQQCRPKTVQKVHSGKSKSIGTASGVRTVKNDRRTGQPKR